MADPTLISNETPYTGFTLTDIVERLLASRGMTLDSATGRTVATTTEQTEAYNRVRRAFIMLSARFPGVWTIQEYEVAWTSGDTMRAVPANCLNVLYVYFNGIPLKPLNRHMMQAINAEDSASSAYRITGDVRYYEVPGITNTGTASDPVYAQVIRLVPSPGTGNVSNVRIGYRIKAPALPSSTADELDNPLPVHEALQEWLLRRAMEIWGADDGDQTTVVIAREERTVIEMDIDELIEGTSEYPKVATPAYPTLPDYDRDDHT